MLAGKVSDDADEQIDPAVGAGVPGRADDHRHTETPRREQHRLEIVHLPLQRARRNIRAERYRPDIARSGIGADQIRLTVAADLKAAGLYRCKAQMSVRANDPKRMVCRTSVLDRNRHAELSSSVSPIDPIATAINPSRSKHDHGWDAIVLA